MFYYQIMSHKKNKNITNEYSFFQHMSHTFWTSAFYVGCGCFLMCVFGLIVSKIIYHIYLNCLIAMYAFSVKKIDNINISQNMNISKKFNFLCSVAFIPDESKNNLQYFDLEVFTNLCDITAHCISENEVKHIKEIGNIQYATSHIFSDCVYAKNVYDLYEMIILSISVISSFVFFIWLIYRICICQLGK